MLVRAKLNRTGRGGSYFAAPKDNMDFIHTGSKMLDLALGGGWVESRVINIVGDKSTGKTLLCIEAAVNFARKYPKGKIRYREVEEAWDNAYAEALGMPLERVDFGEPLDTVEDMFEELQYRCTHAKQPELFIVDSLDALSDRAEVGRDMDKGSYGAEKAKKMSQLFRRLVRNMATKHITLIIVSQIRDKIGVTFGRKTARTGGRALDFYASQVVYLSQLEVLNQTIEKIKRPVGVLIKAKVDKNKVSLPYREVQFPIMFGYGIDDLGACLEWAKEAGCLPKILDGMKEAAFLKHMETTQNYSEDLSAVHAIIESKWYDIEKMFLSKRKKY